MLSNYRIPCVPQIHFQAKMLGSKFSIFPEKRRETFFRSRLCACSRSGTRRRMRASRDPRIPRDPRSSTASRLRQQWPGRVSLRNFSRVMKRLRAVVMSHLLQREIAVCLTVFGLEKTCSASLNTYSRVKHLGLSKVHSSFAKHKNWRTRESQDL